MNTFGFAVYGALVLFLGSEALLLLFLFIDLDSFLFTSCIILGFGEFDASAPFGFRVLWRPTGTITNPLTLVWNGVACSSNSVFGVQQTLFIFGLTWTTSDWLKIIKVTAANMKHRRKTILALDNAIPVTWPYKKKKEMKPAFSQTLIAVIEPPYMAFKSE